MNVGSVQDLDDTGDVSITLYSGVVYHRFIGSAFGSLSKYSGRALFVGIDPGGVNSGIAMVAAHFGDPVWAVNLFQIKLPSNLNPVRRIDLTRESVGRCLQSAHFRPADYRQGIFTTVEYAAHGMPFGQVALAEARVGAIIAMQDLGFGDLVHIVTVPPMTIRKEVFGSGLCVGHVVWKSSEVQPDCLDGLANALFGIRMFIKSHFGGSS